MDIVEDVAAPAVVIQANEGDNPTYHIERGPDGYVVAVVIRDELKLVGSFYTLDEAVCSIGSVKHH